MKHIYFQIVKAVCVALSLTLLVNVAYAEEIHGYTYGSKSLRKSPVSLKQLEDIKKSLLFTTEDERYLKLSQGVLEPQIDEVLDVWYGFVGSNDHLVYYFSDTKTGKPHSEYLAKVRKRFGKWILDTAKANYDQSWLNYQYEIALRHHSTKKNKTDGINSVPIIHFRHLVALTYPITATLKPFLEKGKHSKKDVDKMHQAWIKSVLLQAILWSFPYVNEGEF